MWDWFKSLIPHKHDWVKTGTILTTGGQIEGQGYIEVCTFCQDARCINMAMQECDIRELCNSIAKGDSQVILD